MSLNQAKILDFYPQVLARLSKCRIFLIIDHCPFCGRRHYHGASGYGHRWAHCLRSVGEMVRGYVLVKEGDQTRRKAGRREKAPTWF